MLKNTHWYHDLVEEEEIPKNIYDEAIKLSKQACPQSVMDEVEEDLDGLTKNSTSLNVIVHRPEVRDLVSYMVVVNGFLMEIIVTMPEILT